MEMSIDGLRIVIAALSTQSLFDAGVGLHKLMRKYEKNHTPEVDKLQATLLRKASIVENELRMRCVTKKITEKRRRGIVIDGREKIRQHAFFRKWYRSYIERQIKQSFYFKRK